MMMIYDFLACNFYVRAGTVISTNFFFFLIRFAVCTKLLGTGCTGASELRLLFQSAVSSNELVS